MGRRGISITGGDVQEMDTDVNIYQRQLAEEAVEKYHLYKRIKQLVEEVEELKERIEQLENPSTISGDEKTW